MSHRCLEPAELEGVRSLPPDAARRREAEDCPRCRRLLHSYREFMEDRSSPPGADAGRAAGPLRAAFERELRGAQREARPRRSVWPAPRLAWGAAALVAAIAAAWTATQWHPLSREADVLRAAPDSAEARIHDRPALLGPRAVPGGLELKWRSVPGADAYRLSFLGEDLTRIADLAPAPDTSAVLLSARLPAGLSAGRTVAWQVEALQGGYVISTSGTALVTLP